MLFEFILDKKSPLKSYESLYSILNDVEKCLKSNPVEAVLRARVAEERFINAILEINGIEIPDDLGMRKNLKLECTANKLNFLFEKGFINKTQLTYLNAVRRAGNIVANQKTEDENDIDANKVVEFLYEAIKIYVENFKEI
ncbi:MAG: DUF4145 domain-containing protein [Ruminococcaceae bacterium]|nr:DUF4145 domain-containing protein [Oscillospiraceae bacterium]